MEAGRQNGDYVPRGWILLGRALLDSEVWTWDPHHQRLWIYLLLKVNAHRGRTMKLGAVDVGYGQVLQSYRTIAEANEYVENRGVRRWSTSRVQRMLSRFEEAGMITTTGTDLGTLITVQNFARFQHFGAYRMEVGTAPGTQSEQYLPIIQNQLPTGDSVASSMWAVWIDELGGSPPHPKLSTGKRRKLLDTLYREQLHPRRSEREPLELFRDICQAVKASPHHMSQRTFHLPESLFRNAERRESWTLRGLTETGDDAASSIAEDWQALIGGHDA